MKLFRTAESRSHGVNFFSLRLCVSAAIFLFTLQAFAQTVSQDLNNDWTFSESGKNKWFAAKVPGTVHTDLWMNGEITDPYTNDNATQVQWVENKTWEYKSTFDADATLWSCKNKDLIFDGLDTYAFVYLNDSLILTGENMFRTYRIDVSKLLKKKANVLRVIFHPASELIAANKSRSDIKDLPGGDRVFIRKAQYQFGWDFGPRLVTCGIWRPVHMEGWNEFQLRDVNITTKKIANDTAFLSVLLPTAGILKKDFHIIISDEKTVFYDKILSPSNPYTGFLAVDFSVAHPKLWWCNGQGKPDLYHFTVSIQSGKIKETETVTTGIRTIELDTIDEALNKTFSFVLNGKNIFMKGANWIPCDNFLPRVSSEKYYSLLKSAQQSNMNMLRVWGGGSYEDDKFYNDCDSLGIMVWQDFMFACGMYPGDNHFVSEVSREANDNVIRLQNHPCISLWCGNNENSEGWENWDWKKDFHYSEKEIEEIKSMNDKLFSSSSSPETGALHEIALYNTSIPFISTSPTTGWGHPEAYKSGDVHYWGVWWGNEPFSAYDTHVGRFVSEYGFQALPPLASFKLFDSNGNFSLTDPVVNAHQKNEKGFATINDYMQRDYPVPKDFSDYIYVSQVMQRDGISKAIQAHRRNMPYCMGTLLWQFNDCWPGITWSANDYYGQPKLLQYALKDLFAPVMVSVIERNDSVLIYVLNEDQKSHQGVLAFRWMSLDGVNARSSISPVHANGESSNMALAFDKKMLMDTLSPTRGVLHVIFNYEDGKTASTDFYFVNTKSLQLAKDPGLSTDVSTVRNADGTYTLTLRTISLAKNIYLTLDDTDSKFSDNGFDLMPYESREILITSKLSAEEITKQLHVQMMNALTGGK